MFVICFDQKAFLIAKTPHLYSFVHDKLKNNETFTCTVSSEMARFVIGTGLNLMTKPDNIDETIQFCF